MKTMRFLFVLSAIVVADLAHAQYILTVDLVQMDPYLGKMCKVRVSEIATGKEVARKTISSIDDASFSVELYALLQGRSYNVDIVVDVNGNLEYDAPPTDHAWRRMVSNATMHTNMTFAPDANFTDTGCPDAFPFSQYNSVWGGKWFNLTFGSTDSIKAAFQTTCDSVFGFFMTKGLFGNPETVMFTFAQAIPEGGDPGDTIKFSLPAPWTGQVCIIGERITADLALMGLQLQFTGTVGAKQILCLYEVLTGGNPFANGYFYVRELSIVSSASELEVALVQSANVSCAGGSDGFIAVTGSGGTPGYMYLWSNGATNSSIAGLTVGEYSVTVTDMDGCTATNSFTVTEPAAISFEMLPHNITCHGLCDGRIFAFVAGGTPPYTYAWSNGSTTAGITELCEGEYSVTVTDMAGCTATATSLISEPDPIVITTISQMNETNGMANGGIDVTVTGGTLPLFYSWSKEGVQFSNDEDVTNLSAGMYLLTVIDANTCVVMSEVYEIQNISGVEELHADFRWYPNPARSYLNVEADIPLSVDLLDMHGKILIQTDPSRSHHITLVGIVPGLYVLSISHDTFKTYKKFVVQ
ncbi:MAG TPA: T9SS type A sorting domain-containing protein [Saprospiraceae bacterium]|nr:T9SS type A sorting domain-containing protein [Saprospiraceae bacterium]